jgi:hypothetical protein
MDSNAILGADHCAEQIEKKSKIETGAYFPVKAIILVSGLPNASTDFGIIPETMLRQTLFRT